jgi:polyisoprenyl-phosphate glycosyltransferase
MKTPVFISVVVPARDEEAVLGEFHARLAAVLDRIRGRSEIVYVDDGSADATWSLLCSLARGDTRVRAVRLSRSFGHQAALSAGIDRASGQAVVTIDADLQDPPELIPDLVAKWREGFSVVHAQRVRRLGEGIAKRAASWLFHRLLRAAADVPIQVDVADFRLLGRAACDVLRAMPERRRYLRGLAVWAGFPQACVPYERQPRLAGRTKYRWSGMLRLALDAVTSFSSLPLRVAGWLGAVTAPAGIALAVIAAVRTAGGRAAGWELPVSLLVLLDGVVLLLVGALGAYVWRIGEEARGRPLYVVREETGAVREEAGPARPLRPRRAAGSGSSRSARRA